MSCETPESDEVLRGRMVRDLLLTDASMTEIIHSPKSSRESILEAIKARNAITTELENLI